MYFPRLKIDSEKILFTARLINDRYAAGGISVVDITKRILYKTVIVMKEKIF